MLSIVVPVYNGAANLVPLTERIKTALAGVKTEWELLFIDDGSTDGSLKVMALLCETNPCFGWFSLERNTGQQMAVLCGLRHSRGEYVITMDDDLQHPPEMIPLLYKAAAVGFDAVYAVPYYSGSGSGGISGGSLRDLFFTLFLGKPTGLRIGSFRIFSRAAVNGIITAAQPFIYISAELFTLQMKVTSIEYKKAAGTENISASRYSFLSRLKLYLKLIYWYGPNFKRRDYSASEQYKIAAKGGCL